MIHILHGDDIDASYQELTKLQKQHKDFEKTYLSPSDEESIYQILLSKGLFESKKFIICENLLGGKKVQKVKPEIFKDLAPDKVVVIWEKQEISPALLNKYSNFAQIKKFKLPTEIFNFLDSISQDVKKTIYLLKKLEHEKVTSISWQLENRLLLLILSKLNFTQNEISRITGRALMSWQLEKLRQQAQSLSIETLKKMFTATLRIETLIKSGKTQVTESTLLSMMLLKYLSHQ